MRDLVQSTAREADVFMTDSSDHVTGKTGLTLTITLGKNGGALSSVSPTVTERSNGHYDVSWTTTHTNTLGDFAVHATSTGADPTDYIDQVVAYNHADAVRLGLTALPNAAAEASGGLYTRGSGAGQINQDANGRIDANAKAWLGGTIPAVGVTGVPKVDVYYAGSSAVGLSGTTAGMFTADVKEWKDTAVATPTVAGVPKVEVSTMDTDSVSAAALKADAVTEIAAGILAAVLDANAPTNAKTVAEHIVLILATLIAKTTGSLEGSAPVIRDLGDTKDRIVLAYNAGIRGLTSVDGS